MIEKLFERTELPFPDDKIEIFTDGNTDYIYVLSDYYAETCIDYGQLIKIREGGKVVDKEKRIIYGNPDLYRYRNHRCREFQWSITRKNRQIGAKDKMFLEI